MKTEIVIGFAGSGKSTYLRENFSDGNVIYHDEWANTFYRSDEARMLIKRYTGESDIEKDCLIRMLMVGQGFYKDYSELGKRCFIEYITKCLGAGNVDAIEIPFFHESFNDFKEKFDVDVVFIKRDVFDCINTLTVDREWSTERINMTIPRQIEDYITFNRLITRYVTQRINHE